MSFASKVLYEGDGVTKSYNVPMPYISRDHVNVYLDEVLQLATMHYTWTNSSTVKFVNAPGDGSAIRIQRWTSPTSTLVDFVDGSTLRANDLDTAYLHTYYLSQEYSDSFNEVINEALLGIGTANGIVEVESTAIITELVARMIDSAAASTLQARIADIDLNAEAIVTLGESLQVQLNTLAQGVAAAVYIQATEPVPGVGGIPNPIPEGARWYDSDDNNAAYIYTAGVWVDINDPRIGNNAAAISVLQVDTADNAAAIVAESLVRSNADSATASTLALIGAENAGGTAFIIDLTTAYVGPTESLGSRFTTLSAATAAAQADADTNAADIITEQTARTNADSAIASDVTALDVRVTSAEGDIVANAAALSTLQTDVSTNAGNISSNASSITTLQTDVDLRSRTYMQALAPTVDLNAGDLWIDSDDNKLYRYNGTVWVEAQDAAIAGNAAALSSLTTTVNTNAGNITANASDISTVQTDITTLQGDVTTAQADIVTNANSIVTTDGNVASNASAITGVQATLSNRNRIFHQGTVPTADNAGDLWIDTSDNNNLHIWTGTLWSPTDNAAMAANASAISTLDSTVTSQGGLITANASAITNVEASVVTVDGRVDASNINITANASAITNAETGISDLEAHYGVTLDVGGRVTGFTQLNDGSSGSFVIVADNFSVVDPVTFTPKIWWDGVAELLQIDGDMIVTGTINGQSMINGTIGSTQIGTNAISTTHISANAVTANEILAGAITADKINVTNLNAVKANTGALTVDGTLTVGTAGKMISTGAGFETGAGFFLGYDTSAYKFYVGNKANGNYLSFDGTDLTVSGIINVGTYSASDAVLVSADTERSAGGTWNGSYSWYTLKTFTTDKAGSVKIKFEQKKNTTSTASPYTNASIRITVNGVLEGYHTLTTSTYVAQSRTITGLSEGDVIDIDGARGTYWGPGAEPWDVIPYVRNADFCADIVFTGSPEVTYN
jgi:hypothetical protein